MLILVAHREDQLAHYTSRILTTAGHRVRRARTWPQAVEIFLAGLCEVVLLDPELPGLRPEALELALLRGGPRRPRVILYGSSSPVELAVKAVVLEVDACLSEFAGPGRLLHVVTDTAAQPMPIPPANPTAFVSPTRETTQPVAREHAPPETSPGGGS